MIKGARGESSLDSFDYKNVVLVRAPFRTDFNDPEAPASA